MLWYYHKRNRCLSVFSSVFTRKCRKIVVSLVFRSDNDNQVLFHAEVLLLIYTLSSSLAV